MSIGVDIFIKLNTKSRFLSNLTVFNWKLGLMCGIYFWKGICFLVDGNFQIKLIPIDDGL